MLFNSYSFILIFLPIVFFGMFWIGRHNHLLAALWLSVSSLAFYAIWDARFVLLLLASVVFNYGAGYWIGLRRSSTQHKYAKTILIAAIAINLALLGYFKYTNFFIDSGNLIFGTHVPALNIILPLGISFFTFTQIAFLVDVYRGIAREYNFIHYLLFVTYFPHLIAGPVLHHKQMMPQFSNPATYRINPEHVAVGLTIFIFGLSKKVLIADNLAEYATPVFESVRYGQIPLLIESWVGALAYTLQLYFDFSAYSDMAIGLSLMFNVRLPMNFDSPYKATSIIDFWRRWHMTLSAFLRDYLYIPLGGNRKGVMRRYIYLMATMLLGGLWHGAGWTFIIWGGLHGVYLVINHGWRAFKVRLGWGEGGWIAKISAGALTFLSVVVAWVFFRSDDFMTAQTLIYGMAGMNGISLPTSLEGALAGVANNFPQLKLTFDDFISLSRMTPEGLTTVSNSLTESFLPIALGLAAVWLLPNVRQITGSFKPTWEDVEGVNTPTKIPLSGFAKRLCWKPTMLTAISGGAFFCFLLLLLSVNESSEFLYFQF